MSIDYKAVGGIGVYVTDALLSGFSEEELTSLKEDRESFLEDLIENASSLKLITFGNAWSGNDHAIVMKDVSTLMDAWYEVDKFQDELYRIFRASILRSDIKVINEVHIW